VRQDQPIVVKGAGDVGSAVAHALFGAGFAVVLVEGGQPATARRGMSFSEAVFDGRAELEGLSAVRADRLDAVAQLLEQRESIPLWTGPLEALLAHLQPGVVVDARMRKQQQPEPQLEQAPLTIGLGPGFRAGETTHLIVETNWGPRLGAVSDQGETEAYTGQPRQVGGYGRQRYSYAPTAGLWRTELRIGQQVRAGQAVGSIDGQPLCAAIGGVVRGVTRDGVQVAVGAKVADVDPRGREAVVAGIAERPRRIAEGVLGAVRDRLPAGQA
jgi:xanthine dehydrogenase accessory factor